MKNVFAYIRVSTIRQGTQGVSLQEQKAAIIDFSKRNNLRIIEWFEEKETAAKQGRPIFTKMLEELRDNQATGVIIHKIDRSARNLKDWATIGDLIDSGIDVHFANESLDLRARGGRLTADIQAVIAADYIRNLREETKKGLYGRLKQGIYPLGAPTGYLDMGGGKAKEVDPKRAPLIQYAFEQYATGEYSIVVLGKILRKKGLTTKSGATLSKTSLSRILRNPFYTGIIKIKRTGETFKGIHQPIISKKLFDKVQLILDNKQVKGKGKHNFLFRRTFKCPNCGFSLTGEKQKGTVYYRCHSKICKANCVSEKLIENKIKKKLQPFQLCEHEEKEIDDFIDDLHHQLNPSTKQEKKRLEFNLKKLQGRIEKLTDAYLDEDIERSIYLKKKEKLLQEITEIENELEEFDVKSDRTNNKQIKKFELLKSLYLSYFNGLDIEKRHILKTVTSNLEVDRKKVIIKLNSPFEELAGEMDLRYCGE